MPDLWLPGVTRVQPTNQGPIPLGLQGAGKRLFTWHTFEAGYNLTATAGARYTNSQNSTPTFCFNPVSGELVQQLPANVGARTLKAAAPARHTNAYGSIHMQIEVIAYARRPWTLDLTAAGAASLVRLMNFLRSWGIPDQWAWDDVDQPAATYAEANRPGYRRQPDRSGHAFHSKWWANDHWDPGAIVPPWMIAPSIIKPDPAPAVPEPKPDPNKGFTLEHLERVESLLDVLGYEGADVWARTMAYQQDHGLHPDGLPGLTETTPHLENTVRSIDQKLDDLNNTIRAQNDKLLGVRFPGAGGARLDEILVATWRKAGTVDPDVLGAALSTIPGGASIDPQQLADALADELAARLTGKEN